MDGEYWGPNIFSEVLGGNDDNRCCKIDFNGNLEQQKQSMAQVQPHQLSPSEFEATPCFENMSSVHMMHFSDLGPKLGLSQTKNHEDIDPVYLNEMIEEHLMSSHQMSQEGGECGGNVGNIILGEKEDQDDDNDSKSVQLCLIGGGEEDDRENNDITIKEMKRKRKRARRSKIREEVESQRMVHIAVERNRRKQMNEHLRVLRSLMPSSYVQRGDQASIIGGVIEFVRDLELLKQCLESQKRRKILDETSPRQIEDMNTPTNSSSSHITMVPKKTQPLIVIENETELESSGQGFPEETAENKSSLGDVEVKLLGFDAMIKILSRRRPRQLIMIIAALEDLHLSILHTNITTMEQTVLYSFSVKITSERRFTAEDIASSIQDVFSFIHASTTMQ